MSPVSEASVTSCTLGFMWYCYRKTNWEPVKGSQGLAFFLEILVAVSRTLQSIFKHCLRETATLGIGVRSAFIVKSYRKGA
jgi:hypothetical protein